MLVQRDCDITLGDNNGYLALHHSAKNDKLNCARFLVKQGTSIEATQADGKTPAHVVGPTHKSSATSHLETETTQYLE